MTRWAWRKPACASALAFALLAATHAAGALVSSGCTGRPPSSVNGEPTPVTIASPESGQSTDESVAQTVEAEDDGALVGVLGSTKGNQPTVGDRILRTDEVRELLGDDWTRWRGRRVRARGRMVDHKCDPRAQCLMDGVIPLLVDLTSLELCRAGPAEREPGAVSCPEAPDCFDQCRQRKDECLATTPKAEQSRCGCADAHCSAGCRKHGSSHFDCP